MAPHTTFHQAVASTGRLSSSDRTDRTSRSGRSSGGDPACLRRRDPSLVCCRGLLAIELRSSPTCRATSISRTRSRAGGHPPRDRGARAAQGARGHHEGRAVDVQDGQLRSGLRHERLWLASRANIPRKRRRSSSTATSRRTPGSSTHDGDQGAGQGQGFVETLLGRETADPRAPRVHPALLGAGEMAINMPIQGTLLTSRRSP